MELKYEDFLAEPVETLKSLSFFCGLPIQEPSIHNIAGRVRKKRAYAYMSNQDLRQFTLGITDRLRTFGY
jgi:hypothetical protein